MIYKTLHRKLTIKHHEPHKNWGWAQMLWKGKKSLKIPEVIRKFKSKELLPFKFCLLNCINMNFVLLQEHGSKVHHMLW